MILGHYAAALVPYSRMRDRGHPLWLLLLAANAPEFLWLALALVGIEPASPSNLLDATFQNLHVDMVYSHNLVPSLLQGVVVTGIVWATLRSRELALWCGALTVVHVLCDFVVGFEHQVLGLSSPVVSLDTYGRTPHLAVFLEAAFAAVAVWYFHRQEAMHGRPRSPKRQAALYAVFLVGILMWLPSATTPMRELLRIPDGF